MKRFTQHIALLITFTLAPFVAQAKVPNQAQTSKDATIRSCPNRLCPVVKVLPKGTKFAWVLTENGFVNIVDTTFWIALTDIK